VLERRAVMINRRLSAIAVLGMTGVVAVGAPRFVLGDDGSVESIFLKMDDDGDGKISTDEHAAAANRQFDAIDKDKNGKVSAAEMQAAKGRTAEKSATPTEPWATDKVKSLDKNGDGAVSRNENASDARTRFEHADSNKDGYVTHSEVEAARGTMEGGAANTIARP
jgi:Ca2+-binding EF-hand superfamily protein